MLKTLKRDLRRREVVARSEVLLLLGKYLGSSKFYYFFLLSTIRNVSFYCVYVTALKNFCIISGRSRGVFSMFKLSRIVLKKFAVSNTFAWLRKA